MHLSGNVLSAMHLCCSSVGLTTGARTMLFTLRGRFAAAARRRRLQLASERAGANRSPAPNVADVQLISQVGAENQIETSRLAFVDCL